MPEQRHHLGSPVDQHHATPRTGGGHTLSFSRSDPAWTITSRAPTTRSDVAFAVFRAALSGAVASAVMPPSTFLGARPIGSAGHNHGLRFPFWVATPRPAAAPVARGFASRGPIRFAALLADAGFRRLITGHGDSDHPCSTAGHMCSMALRCSTDTRSPIPRRPFLGRSV